MSVNEGSSSRTMFVASFAIISVAIVGYFVGLQSPMNPSAIAGVADGNLTYTPDSIGSADAKTLKSNSSKVIDATAFSEMHAATERKSATWKTSLANLKWTPDLLAEVSISPGDKALALEIRSKTRAYNGAPPTVPHSVAGMTDASCTACHTNGAKMDSLRIPTMPHKFLSNCTQCHVESAPKLFAEMPISESLASGNSFVGIPAPTAGPRAFKSAPPQIPHTTWMRSNCMSCHGYAGLQGLRTTHPWRENCQQCHANESKLDQVMPDTQPSFLPAPTIK